MDFSHYTSNRSQLTVIKALRLRLPALNLDPGFGGFYWWTSVALLRCTYQGKWSFRICWFPQFSGRFWGRWWTFISITWCHNCFLFFWNNNSLLHLKQTDKFALFPATNTSNQTILSVGEYEHVCLTGRAARVRTETNVKTCWILTNFFTWATNFVTFLGQHNTTWTAKEKICWPCFWLGRLIGLLPCVFSRLLFLSFSLLTDLSIIMHKITRSWADKAIEIELTFTLPNVDVRA